MSFCRMKAIEACPPGQVLVMDARRDASAANGGDILRAEYDAAKKRK